MSPHVDAGVLADNLTDDVPTVLMNTRGVDAARYPSFQVDNHGGAVAVVRHLVEQGRRRVAHIAGPESNFEASERLRGYLDALAEFAPEVEPQVLEGDFFEESGQTAGERLAADPPEAVFAANDMMAVGCMTALVDAGLRVPEDVALAGFDDIPIARLVRPGLTTARVKICDLGRRALERLAGAIEGRAEEQALEIVRPELVVRDSTTRRITAP
jgi:LacI family transcriptional regulator